MRKSGVKALCVVVGLSLAGLSPLVQAAVQSENAGGAAQSAPVAQKTEKALLPAADEDEVSVNLASAQELAEVMNGVGIKKAEAIVNYREQNGPFTQIEQLQEVPGIGAALLERNLSRLKL
ncbi:ComEA family DNA-binding protein [Brenneria tiliae]|uniref:ComEA family DNA-binding protein n=1 Tax=Brenneria tiliae TaxID=2914984 RepID=UPI002014CD33|nr:helix-hairpin-helix domain-containing protein [Brenneria tiliae]MCL2897594.1 helix-hairpin-helix domain-containing protein [Brenneria tiliae]MCL2901839.1 helix-hairpin-helix domain-containing protein [Brenneria tiliae]